MHYRYTVCPFTYFLSWTFSTNMCIFYITYILDWDISPFTFAFTFTFHLGFAHLLQDVAFHQCLPLSSVYCFPVPGGFSFAMSSCHLLPGHPLDLFPLSLSAAFGPPIALHSCYMSSPFLFLFQRVFYNVHYICYFPDL